MSQLMDSKTSASSSLTARPRIEDVLKPPTQIIANIDNGTLPRTTRRFPKPEPIHNEAPANETNLNQPNHRFQQHTPPVVEGTFIRWRSFNTGMKYPSASHTTPVNGLRPNGLDKLLANEEKEKQKALNLKAVDPSQQSVKSFNNKALDKKETLSKGNGIYTATPVNTLFTDSSKPLETMEHNNGVYEAKPAYVKDSDDNNALKIVESNEAIEEQNQNPISVDSLDGQAIPKHIAPPKPVRITKLAKDMEFDLETSATHTSTPTARYSNGNNPADIQEAIKVILEAATSKTLTTPGNDTTLNYNFEATAAVPNSPAVHLGMPTSAPIIVININNVGNNMATQQDKKAELNSAITNRQISELSTPDTPTLGNGSHVNASARLTTKSKTLKTLTPFQLELLREIRGFQKETLKTNPVGQKWN